MAEQKIGVVGPCGAGKTTLVNGLKALGLNGKNIAQEHSYVADMWQRLSRPSLLVYLHVSYSNSKKRRNMDWTEAEYREQLFRLRHARQGANLWIDTDELDANQVLEKVIEFLKEKST